MTPVNKESVQKWEYLVEENSSTFSIKIAGVKWNSNLDYLNTRGKDGWQLIQGPTHGFSVYIFKRPITN
jgi:hypothetical protein